MKTFSKQEGKTSSKGQMEIFGLVIIAVLGAIFLVFALANSAGDPPELQHQAFGDNSLASSFINTLVNTDVSVCGEEYTVLVKDCANGQPFVTCQGRTSCYWINDTAHQVIERTLDVWGEEYKFTVKNKEEMQGQQDLIEPIKTQNCGPQSEKESPGIQLIPLYPAEGSAEVRLDICA